MMKKRMRCSMHSGAGKGSAKHNDHNPETKNASWDKEKSKDNEFFVMTNAEGDIYNDISVEEGHLLFYKDFYGATLEKQNQKHIDRRQSGRVRTMEEWMKASQHKPVETIFQIGDKDSDIDVDALKAAYTEFSEWKEERFKENYRCISVSLHVDEATPHIHEDGIWFWHDEDGLPVPGIKKAMAEAGVPLPDPTKPEGKDNYRKAVVDAECRAKWQEVCIAHGFDIETEPKKVKQEHMGKRAYSEYQTAMQAIDEREASLADREAALDKREASLSARESNLKAQKARFGLEVDKRLNKLENVLKEACRAAEDYAEQTNWFNLDKSERKRLVAQGKGLRGNASARLVDAAATAVHYTSGEQNRRIINNIPDWLKDDVEKEEKNRKEEGYYDF